MAALLLMISKGQVAIWVRLAEWVLVEADLPEPMPGSTLTHAGIRVYGIVEHADDVASDGLVAESEPTNADPTTPLYRVTGRVESSQDFSANMGSGSEHAGLELVLDVADHRFQAQVDGPASDVRIGARVSVRGELFVIGAYEWESFGLVDTRTNWKIEETINQPDGDFLLRLVAPPAD